jgi:hypothetical protein
MCMKGMVTENFSWIEQRWSCEPICSSVVIIGVDCVAGIIID